MSRFSMILAGMASLALAAPAAAQQNLPAGGGRGHSPQVGTPAGQATARSAATIRAASGGGKPHAPRTGPRHRGGTSKPTKAPSGATGRR